MKELSVLCAQTDARPLGPRDPLSVAWLGLFTQRTKAQSGHVPACGHELLIAFVRDKTKTPFTNCILFNVFSVKCHFIEIG